MIALGKGCEIPSDQRGLAIAAEAVLQCKGGLTMTLDAMAHERLLKKKREIRSSS
ncbi:MAG: hypothetical protein ABL931_01395 [Usitatibacteraceae bacterium]